MAMNGDETDDTSWVLELETALLDECARETVLSICKGQVLPENLRAEAWQSCLEVTDRKDKLLAFNEIFDLPEQTVLREDCQLFVEKLGNEEEDKVSVLSDLESVLTFYCKSEEFKYERGNGWIEILAPLIALKLPRSDIYNCFDAIRTKYISRFCHSNGKPFHLFRLLLLYHDPELCSFLDTKRITPDMYGINWFQSLFAATCNLKVVLAMWDVYFQRGDPFFVFFLALVMIVNARDQILSMKEEPKQSIIETLSSMPCDLDAGDVVDFCSLAQYYSLKTPSSYRKEIGSALFSWNCDESNGECGDKRRDGVSQALCLPVSALELVQSSGPPSSDVVEPVRFFLVDCRPAEQYNAGHLPTAFHLDCNLMLQEPAAFATAVQGLLSAQRQALAANSAAGGEHLCFLGSGREEEDQYTHMVVASFLQKHTQYVSLVSGGYQGIHEYLGEDVSLCLNDHVPSSCLACSALALSQSSGSLNENSSSVDLFGKISAAMKLKSAEVKEKLFEYIVNPTAGQATERHVSSTDRVGKRYRNLGPVFSIGDDQDTDVASMQSNDDQDLQEVVSIATWIKKPEVIDTFQCREVKVNGYAYNSHLLVTDTHLFILRDIPERRGFAHIAVRRPLSSIVKITAKKRHPELITLKYGVSEGDNLLISDMDRLLIPDAKVATKLISDQILKLLKSGDG